jgi:quinol monooxygenase YgiN
MRTAHHKHSHTKALQTKQNLQCIASFTVVEDMINVAKKLIGDLQAASRREEGCIQLDLYLDERSLGKFALVGEWCSVEHLQAHLASQHVSDFNTALKQVYGVTMLPPAIKFYKFIQ